MVYSADVRVSLAVVKSHGWHGWCEVDKTLSLTCYVCDHFPEYSVMDYSPVVVAIVILLVIKSASFW